jgi:hypothetical protein
LTCKVEHHTAVHTSALQKSYTAVRLLPNRAVKEQRCLQQTHGLGLGLTRGLALGLALGLVLGDGVGADGLGLG